MHVRDAVHTKRAIREFAATALSATDLNAILEAGRRAHSARLKPNPNDCRDVRSPTAS